MAEYIPPIKTIFSVKIIDNQFVVENHNSGITITEGNREYYHSCLNNFESALVYVNKHNYDKDVISQLLLSNTRLSLCIPNKRIEELESSLAPLRHNQVTNEFILGAETDEPSQQAAENSPGR